MTSETEVAAMTSGLVTWLRGDLGAPYATVVVDPDFPNAPAMRKALQASSVDQTQTIALRAF